jgi:hypothetical protein
VPRAVVIVRRHAGGYEGATTAAREARPGGPLQRQAREYRVIYRIDDDLRIVTVMAIEHRSDIYRPRQR